MIKDEETQYNRTELMSKVHQIEINMASTNKLKMLIMKMYFLSKLVTIDLASSPREKSEKNYASHLETEYGAFCQQK